MKLIGASIYSFTDHLFSDLGALGIDISKAERKTFDGESQFFLKNSHSEFLNYVAVEQDDDFRSHHQNEGESAICPKLYVDFNCSIDWMPKVNTEAIHVSESPFKIQGAWIHLDPTEQDALCADLKVTKADNVSLNPQQKIWFASSKDSHFKSFVFKKKFPFWGLIIEAPQLNKSELPQIKIGEQPFAWLAQNSIGWDLLIKL